MEVYGLVAAKRGKSNSVELILRALNGRLSHRVVSALLTGRSDGIEKEMAQTDSELFSMMLRFFVDAWIDSGKKEGAEYPWERTTPLDLLQDYLARNPPLLRFTEKGPSLVLFPDNRGEQKELSPFLKAALATQPDARLHDFSRKIPQAAWDAATALLLQLLDSTARTRLFRCDGCGTYYLLQRLPRKDTPIKRGSWCASCKRDGKDRVRRTKESRDQRTDRRIGLAADAWPQWKPDRRHRERAEWVAEQVNKKLPANANHIAKNWVTRHQNEIEAEVEGRKHAKG